MIYINYSDKSVAVGDLVNPMYTLQYLTDHKVIKKKRVQVLTVSQLVIATLPCL